VWHGDDLISRWYTKKHDRGAWSPHADGLHHDLGMAHSINDSIYAAPSSPGLHLLYRVHSANINHLIRSQVTSQLQALWLLIQADDSNPLLLEQLNHQEPDAAGSNHRGRVSRACARCLDRMKGTGQGFCQRS
jgi:hypothetical protein